MNSTTLPRTEVLAAFLGAKEDKCEEIQQFLIGLAQEVRKRPGCLSVMASRELPLGARFLLYSVWSGAEALAGHLASEDFRILLGACQLLGKYVSFEFVSNEPGQVQKAIAAFQDATAQHHPEP